MGVKKGQRLSSELWEIAREQHGVVARRQLLELGYSSKAIAHRVAKGRLHVVWRGVYAIGRPTINLRGRWMAAVLSCGPEAFLSHEAAAALWMIRPSNRRRIDVSVFSCVKRPRPDVVVHRRYSLVKGDVTRHEAIPVTTPICTLIDLATVIGRRQLVAAVNEADRLRLTDPEKLRSALRETASRPGVRALREILDRSTFALRTRSSSGSSCRSLAGLACPCPRPVAE
jgi:hypothetical protein